MTFHSLASKKRILNLGCGNDTYGTDRVDLYKTPTTTAVFDCSKPGWPYPDNTFDEVYAMQIFEHLPNVKVFVDEVARVLKKGGVFKMRTDYAGYLLWGVGYREHNNTITIMYKDNAFGHTQGDDRHYYLFVPSHIEAFLEKKFTNVQVTYVKTGRNFLFTWMRRALPNNWGASQLDVLATKL